MPDDLELVERLRDGPPRDYDLVGKLRAYDALSTEAAAEIERLEASNAALMDERSNILETKRQQLAAKDAEIERLLAERDESDHAASAMSSDLFRMADERDKLKDMVEQAFRDGLIYATNCIVTDPDEAWRTSRARQALQDSKT